MSVHIGPKRSFFVRFACWRAIACIVGVLMFATVATADVLVNNPGTDTTGAQTQSQAALLVFGSTVIAAFQDSGSFPGTQNKFTGYARSTDGGLTFTDLGTLPTNALGDAGYPHLARDNLTGTVYLTTLGFSSALQVFRSFDNGLTFGPPVNAAGALQNSQLDTIGLAVDNFAGQGRGNVYVAVRDFGANNGIYLMRSTDGGVTFGPPIQIASAVPGNVQGPNIVVGPDHQVTVSYFQTLAGVNSLVERRSTDTGFTFGPPVSIGGLATTTVNGDLQLTGQPAGAGSAAVVSHQSVSAGVDQPGDGCVST